MISQLQLKKTHIPARRGRGIFTLPNFLMPTSWWVMCSSTTHITNWNASISLFFFAHEIHHNVSVYAPMPSLEKIDYNFWQWIYLCCCCFKLILTFQFFSFFFFFLCFFFELTSSQFLSLVVLLWSHVVKSIQRIYSFPSVQIT